MVSALVQPTPTHASHAPLLDSALVADLAAQVACAVRQGVQRGGGAGNAVCQSRCCFSLRGVKGLAGEERRETVPPSWVGGDYVPDHLARAVGPHAHVGGTLPEAALGDVHSKPLREELRVEHLVGGGVAGLAVQLACGLVVQVGPRGALEVWAAVLGGKGGVLVAAPQDLAEWVVNQLHLQALLAGRCARHWGEQGGPPRWSRTTLNSPGDPLGTGSCRPHCPTCRR